MPLRHFRVRWCQKLVPLHAISHQSLCGYVRLKSGKHRVMDTYLRPLVAGGPSEGGFIITRSNDEWGIAAQVSISVSPSAPATFAEAAIVSIFFWGSIKYNDPSATPPCGCIPYGVVNIELHW